jgi:hypothetical protein
MPRLQLAFPLQGLVLQSSSVPLLTYIYNDFLPPIFVDIYDHFLNEWSMLFRDS